MPMGPKTKNDCVGKGQKQITTLLCCALLSVFEELIAILLSHEVHIKIEPLNNKDFCSTCADLVISNSTSPY
jgi:hypothetical protein